MSDLTLRIVGDGIERFGEAVKVLGQSKARSVFRMAVNDAGRKTKTATGRALAKQTGLKYGTTRKALDDSKASNNNLEYSLTGRGGDISLKYFKPKETDVGVEASPFGKKTVFAGSFMKGGIWPGGRSGFVAGGHVLHRLGATRNPVDKTKSGVVIPNEMVKGITASAFERVGQETLSIRLSHHLKRATKGAVS